LPPVWVFSALDEDGPWGKSRLTDGVVWSDILPKIRSFEAMTWAELEADRKKHHSVPVAKFIKLARDRIDDIGLDVDELFRFRLTGLQRLWGIRDRDRFKIIWWDPKHEICPSPLKHT
jgi:hypothetical protein